MRVRAIADGTFKHPEIGECYAAEGDIFDIPDEPYFVLDGDGKKIAEMETVQTKEGHDVTRQKKDKDGKPVWKTGSWFSETWMEKVPKDVPLTPIEKQPQRTVIDVWNQKKRTEPRSFSELANTNVI